MKSRVNRSRTKVELGTHVAVSRQFVMLSSRHMKKHLLSLGVLGLISLAFVSPVMAGLLYPYSRLATKDLDQMNKIVRDKIHESQKSSGNRIVPLKEAIQAVYSRPNEDFMIEKVMSQLKTELEEHDAYESTFHALVKEASGALKNPKAFKPEVQVTYWIFLENVVAEMKPRARDKFEASILTSIRDAKIVLTKEAKSERRLRMMRESECPSDTAEAILKVAVKEAAQDATAEKSVEPKVSK